MKMGSRVQIGYFVDAKTMTDYSGKKGQVLTRERGGKWGVRIDGVTGPNKVIPENQLTEIEWDE
ncbi:hypothetical protein SEA_TOMAS_210 [Streptomyces phage Tomas]|uniref:Uncharacterized protein n=1 Tax=Streptomyces phage Tomas TaxID=2914443 RepID=A0AA49BTD2_9CAUD|nr:hypothetical protein PP453_gp110 [Streptomyces phage Tomas]UMO76357.1 hypothetical protein SEA_TOMAS_210 [Streptomyces phage Tomas]